MLFAHPITHSLSISIEQVLHALLMIVTIIQIFKTYVYSFTYSDKHLTNVAININSPNYIKRIGGKWFLEQLKKFMLSK